MSTADPRATWGWGANHHGISRVSLTVGPLYTRLPCIHGSAHVFPKRGDFGIREVDYFKLHSHPKRTEEMV